MKNNTQRQAGRSTSWMMTGAECSTLIHFEHSGAECSKHAQYNNERIKAFRLSSGRPLPFYDLSRLRRLSAGDKFIAFDKKSPWIFLRHIDPNTRGHGDL